MQKIEIPASSPSNTRRNACDPVFWGLIVLATLLLLGSSWLAWKQEPHPDAYRATPGWLSKDFWLYPVERNAFKRLPAIRANLRVIHVHADGQRGWAAGDGGTILHTADGGKSWQEIVYRFYPAPWFYLLLFLVIALYALALAFAWRSWKFRQASKQAPIRLVSDHAATPGQGTSVTPIFSARAALPRG